MFNFDKWSEKVFRLMEQMQRAGGDGPPGLQEELNALWLEMMEHTDDEAVQFLNQVLAMTRKLVDGAMDSGQFEQFMQNMRNKAFDSPSFH